MIEVAKHINEMVVLYADDDPEDRLLAKEAFEESCVRKQLRFVEDGEELLSYLLRKGKYADGRSYPQPGIILLDLNMPRKDGREVLKEIKAHPTLRKIPVIVFTTSNAEEDIIRTYELGVSSFITKPVSFDSFVEIMKVLNKYWFEVVKLPIAQ